MFVPAASSMNSSNNNNHINCNSNITNNIIHHSDGPDSLNATYISVVSTTFYLWYNKISMKSLATMADSNTAAADMQTYQ